MQIDELKRHKSEILMILQKNFVKIGVTLERAGLMKDYKELCFKFQKS